MIEYELGDLIKIYNGKNYSHLKKGTIPVYGTGGIMLYVSDFLYEGKAILLPRKGSLSNIMYTEGKIWTVDTMYYASVNENIVNPYYLYRYLTLLDLAHLDSGSTLPSMTQSAYTNLKINLPEISIQNKIANILSTLDSKIELNNKINKELEILAKTLYDYWFVQFDFPDENGKPYKSSGGKMVYNQELKREIPQGWEIKKLKELLINCTDGISNLKLNTEDKYTPIDYLPMKRMSFGDYLPSSEANSSLIQYKAKDILIGAMRVYFHRVCIAPFDGITRTTSLVLRPINEKHLPYLYQVCNEEKTISVATKLSSGTQQPYVNWEKSLENYKIAYPNNILLIDKYSDKINNIINQVVLNEQQNQELAKLRDWLLPMLMNGQVRIAI